MTTFLTVAAKHCRQAEHPLQVAGGIFDFCAILSVFGRKRLREKCKFKTFVAREMTFDRDHPSEAFGRQ
jgi:hypothetical protein